MLKIQENNSEQFQLPEEFADIASILQIDAQLMGDHSIKAVDARELRKALGVKRDFSKWIPEQITRCILEEGADYLRQVSELEKNAKKGNLLPGGGRRLDIHLTMDAAKKISVLSQTPAGNMVWKYFLFMEKTAQQAIQNRVLKLQSDRETNPTVIAAQEASKAALALSDAVKGIWGAGYIQKMTHSIFESTDKKYGTSLQQFLPLPEASPDQVETIDPTQGQHLLKAATGSVELSSKELATFFGVRNVSALNKALEALGYHRPLKKDTWSRPSGYELTAPKKDYALQKKLDVGPFSGKLKIVAWYLNAFSEMERDTLKKYLSQNHAKDLI